MNLNPLKSRRSVGIAAVSTALLVPLGIIGAPALARTAAAQYEYGGSQYQYKIQICHHTHSKKHPMHTIWVSANAWKGHSHHGGDTLGACPPAAPVSAPTSGKQHGKSDEQHGKSSVQHGKGHGK